VLKDLSIPPQGELDLQVPRLASMNTSAGWQTTRSSSSADRCQRFRLTPDETETGPDSGDNSPYNYYEGTVNRTWRSTCGGASAAPTRQPALKLVAARRGGGRSCSA